LTAYYDAITWRRTSPPPRTRNTPTDTNNDEHGRQ
jgi:hypothetical protein